MKRLALALLLSGCCCGSEPPAPTTTVAPPTSLTPVANPTTLTIGAPPVTITAPAAPEWSFAVATAGEYQLDATAPAPQDVQLTVLDPRGWSIASDGDGGDGVNARLAVFLQPATYTVRVSEQHHGAADVEVRVTTLEALTSMTTLTPGAPAVTVDSPVGDWSRAASAEVTITITAAGTYRIHAQGDAECTSEMELIQNDAVLAENSYGGPNSSAQIDQPMQPGAYTLRLRDTINRACTHSVSVALVP